MTLNQVVQRIKNIVLAHKQVRSFNRGLISDFLTDHTTKYPTVFLNDVGGSIGLLQNTSTLTYRLWFADLVHVAADTKENELDVLSDMYSLALDIVAEINNPNYSDWRISIGSLQLFVENEGDMHAGCYIDFTVTLMFTQNRCEVPTDEIDFPTTDNTDMKLVYDEKYTATGNEGSTLSVPAVVGKKILFVSREFMVIYKVSANPDPAEFTWNDVVLGLGTVTSPGERFLILYRTY